MNKIRVAHKSYSLKWADYGLTDEPCNGICDHEGSKVLVYNKLTGWDRKETLLHEVMHAVWHMWNMRDEAGEEETVSAMARGLTTVFKDNPELAKYLISKPKE